MDSTFNFFFNFKYVNIVFTFFVLKLFQRVLKSGYRNDQLIYIERDND